VVRPDQWQSLHDVYVRDRYKLGTRAWLEGSNRAAFAQTLERMLDAVRLGYWQPDSATRRELVQAYDAASRASGLKERNAEVARFAAADLAARSAAPVRAPASAPVEADVTRNAQGDVKPLPPDVPTTAAIERLRTEPVQGLKLERVPDTAAPPANAVVTSLWVALGAALLMALGGVVQWRRGRRTSSGAAGAVA
jgi:cobaltochelatase CobN